MNAVKITVPVKERECGICGKPFVVTHQTQKYCPDCRTSSDRKLVWITQNIEASKRRYDQVETPKKYNCVCVHCGKNFEAWVALKYFCSKRCKNEYELEHTVCAYCGKSILNSDGEGVRNPNNVWFCSKEHEIAHAYKLGHFKTCPECGTDFFYKNTTYCSRECAQKSLSRIQKLKAEERKNPEAVCKECGKTFLKASIEKSMFHLHGFCSIECRRKHFEKTMTGTMELCRVCGKDFFKSVDESIVSFCSEACAELDHVRYQEEMKKISEERERLRHIKEEEKRRKQEERELKRKERNNKKRKKRDYLDASTLDPEWIRQNGLCGICRTPYKECTWMRTNFSVKPAGAFYENSKIVSCPCFKG